MNQFKIDCALQFPIFKLIESVQYNEVEKPSGISYILLTLIDEYGDDKRTIRQIIESIGVPKNLIEIFDQEAKKLEDDGMIKFGLSIIPTFSDALISDIKLTPKGRKLFNDGYVAVGDTKTKHVDLYYEVATKKLTLGPANNLEAKPLSDGAITEEYALSFGVEKDQEEYINGLERAMIGLKKEEDIVAVKEDERIPLFGKYPVSLIFAGENFECKAKSSSIDNFIKESYKAEFITKSIKSEEKNDFDIYFKSNRGMSFENIDGREVVDIHLPKEYPELMSRNYKIFVSKRDCKNNSALSYVDKEIIEGLDSRAEALFVNRYGNGFLIIPGEFEFKNNVLGKINVNLIAVANISPIDLRCAIEKVAEAVIAGEFSADKVKSLMSLVSTIGDYDFAKSKIESFLGDDDGDNLHVLLNVRDIVSAKPEMKGFFNGLVENSLARYIDGINGENAGERLSAAKWALQYLRTPSAEIIKNVLGKTGEKGLNIYLSLRKAFKAEEVLPFVCPIEEILASNQGDLDEIINLRSFDGCISALDKMMAQDEYNQDEFLGIYRQAKSMLQHLYAFKSSAPDIIGGYENKMSRFGEMADCINDLKAAQKSIGKLKIETVIKEIDKGNYSGVIADLAAKAEHGLREMGYVGTFSDMLREAKSAKAIPSKEDLDLIYKFKELRNAKLHPDDREDLEIRAEDLRSYAEAIFRLGKEEK